MRTASNMFPLSARMRASIDTSQDFRPGTIVSCEEGRRAEDREDVSVEESLEEISSSWLLSFVGYADCELIGRRRQIANGAEKEMAQ